MAIDWNKAMSSSESNKKKKSEIDWEKAGAYSKEKLDSFSRYEKKTTTSKPTTSVPKNESYKPEQSPGIENKYSKIQPEKKTKTEKSVQTYQKQPYANANKRATGYVDMKADEHLASVGSKAESMTDAEREKFLTEYISKPNKDMSASDVVLKQNQAKSKKAWDEEKAEYKATRKQGATDKTTEYKDKFYDMSYEERKLIGLGDEESLDTLKSEYGYTDDDITAMTYFYNRHVNKKKAQQEEINARVKMEQHPFLESVANVPMGLVGGVGSLLGIADSYIDNRRVEKLGIEDQGLDYNHQLGSWQRQAQAGRQEFTNTHDLMIGDYDIGDMLYNTALSGLESATAAVIPGGAVLLGVNAGTSKANELARRGMSSEQAINGGIVAGVVEGLFEKYSIGKLKKLQDVPVHTVKDLVTNIGKSMVTNFEEEAATELANIIYDSIAHGDKSEYQTEVNNLVASGEFTEKEAQKEALIGQVLQVIEAGASGALMGGVMGGIASGIAYETDYRNRKAIGQAIKESGYAEDVVKEARQSNDKAVQEWVKRINKTNKTTDRVNVKDADLGGAFRSLAESGKRETVETNTESVENKPLTSEERVEISNPTLESKDGKVVSVASVELVKDGKITVKDTEGNSRTLDTNTLEGKTKALWTYASEHFTDGKVVENFVKSYEGGDVDTYIRLYKGVFDLASVGMSAEKIVSENIFEHRVLGEKAFKSAVESGHTAMTYKAGVVDLTTEKKSKSQELTMKIADSFGKRHGMNIVFVDTLGTREGFLTQGKNQIVIALDASGGAISRTLGHETFHYVKIESPEQAKQITDFVVDTMTRLKGAEWVESRYEFYAGQGYESRDAQIEEFVADQMFEVFSSERAVKEFVSQDMNLAQKVISHIRDAIAEIKSIIKKLVATGRYEDIAAWQEDLDALEQVNNMMLDALANIEQRKNTGQKAEKNTSDEVKNATKREVEITQTDIDTLRSIGRKSINEFTSQDLSKTEKWAIKFYKELGTKSPFFRAWFGDWRANDNQTVTKVTVNTKNIKPSDIPRTGTKNLDTGWNVNVSGKGIEKTASQQKKWSLEYHSLSSINSMLENAILFDTVAVDKPSKKLGKNVAFLHHMYVPIIADGNEMVAKLYVTEEIGDEHKFYLIKAEAVFTDSRGDSNKASRQFSSSKTASINTVADLFDFVKERTADFERDSDNPILFQPKPVSEIVNADGTPKVMYHGTPNQFTLFDKKKARSSGYYGRGFYFTDSKSHSSHYGNAMAVYLDVKNPLEQGKNHITKKQLRNFLEAVAENEDDYDIWNYGTEDIDEIINNIYKDDAFAVIQDVNATTIGDLAEAIDLFNKVNKTNYDGVVTPTEVVAYKPTQIKSATDNIGTFDKDNPDILFSTKRAVEETKDLIAVHNMQESELLKTLQLGGFPMPSIAIIKARQGHSEYGPVSVVFNKSTIDPKANKNNKVYGGDAWTPTYPTIEYKINDKVQEKISNLYYELYRKYGADEARPLYNYAYDMERQLNSNRGEAGMIESLKDDERLMQLYLLQSGKGKVEPVIKQTVTELSEADVEMYDYLISAIGKDVVSELKTPPGKNPLQYRAEFYEKNGEKIENAYKQMLRDNFEFTENGIDNVMDNMRKGDFINLIRRTYQYMVNGKTTTKEETDSKATSEAIRNAIKDSGFNQWVDDLFKGVEEKSGIRNNADYFTASGNRRSWEALHWENTLENVVKVMKLQNNGVAAFFSGHAIWAVSAKDYKSVDELKADSDRLKSLPKEEYEAIKEGFGMRLNEIATSIMDKSESNQFIAADNAMQCIVEAVRNSKTKSGILNELKQYRQLDVTETAVDDIVSLVSDISNMPTEYFEAKPQRAVGLDEIAYVVVPDTSTELVETLNEQGIETRTYTAGDEADRVRALNSDESVLFSTKRESLLSEDAINYIQDTEEFQEIISIVDERYNLTNRKMLSPQAIERFAGSILSKAHSKYDKGLLVERLTALFDYMVNSSELEWNDIMSVTAEIANDVLTESKRLDRTMSEEYKDTLKYLKGLTIYINPSVRAKIESRYGDIENYRRALGGRTHVTVKNSNAYHLDSLWRELSEDRPEMFDADLNALEQAEALANFFDMTKPTLSNPYGMYMEEAAYDFALQIYDEYFEIPEVKSEARRYALREERLKGKYGAKIKEIRKSYEERMSNIRKLYKDKLNKVKAEDREKYEKLRSDKNARIEQTKLLYQERNRNYRDKRNETAEKQKLRAQIVRQSKGLIDKLIKPTETKHIPQELIKGVTDFSRALTNGGIFPIKKAVALTEAFNRIDEKGEDPNFFISSMYDEEIQNMLKLLTTTLADKRLSEMTVDELLTIRNISRYFNHIIRESNETFAMDKKMKITELQEKTLEEFESQDKDKQRMANEFQTNLLKPSVFFDLLESPTLNKLYQNIQKGGFGYARTIKQDREKFDSLKEKYDYELWEDKVIELETERGQKIKINVPTALSIYATAKRNQGVDHIMMGGIVLEEDAIKKVDKKNRFKSEKKTDNTVNVKGDNIPMTIKDVQDLLSKLTKEQKDCADEVVSYLSKEKSELGNAISMALFGYKRYNESYYFPIKSAPDFLYTKPGVEIDSRIKHMSMTKSTVPKANNPVVIGDFFDTAMGHCSNMALYYNLTLPLEDFNRVFNYKTTGDKQTSVKQQLGMVYGKNAEKYIKNFITDVNGGVTQQPMSGWLNKWIGKAKKNAVFGSLSVAVQQPSAITRAAIYIDPKYFVGKQPKGTWEEIQEYAPVAIIKDMGYFDMNIGRSAVEWMNHREPEGFKGKLGAFFSLTDSSYRDEILTWLPSVMDKITWGRIWVATKNEIKDTRKDLDVNSEEFLEAVGERFTYVIDQTQVYDSVFSRSGIMRSKDTGLKVATSFMAEPLTNYNILAKGMIEAKKGKAGKRFAVRSVTAYLSSVVLNSLLKSLVQASRDDDEEKSFLEKYIAYVVSNITEDPFSMIPFYSEISSLLQGFDSKRMDTQLFADLVNSVSVTFDPDKSVGEKIKAILGAVGVATGTGLKNIIRDIEAGLRMGGKVKDLIKGEFEPTTGRGILYAILEQYDSPKFKASVPNLAEQVIEAYFDGDMAHYNKQKANMLEKYDGDAKEVKKQLSRKLGDMYKEGKIDKKDATRIMRNTLGKNQKETDKAFKNWEESKENAENE